MGTLKNFFKFAIVFIILYVVFDILTFAYIKTTYNDIEDYEILIQTPEVTVTQARATKVNGYIKGTITNNTSSDITTIYLKADLTSKNDNYLGYESTEITDLKEGETREFEIKYKFSNVGSFKLSKTDVLQEKSKIVEVKISDEIRPYLFITSILLVIYRSKLIKF